jgi:hypothetical protein
MILTIDVEVGQTIDENAMRELFVAESGKGGLRALLTSTGPVAAKDLGVGVCGSKRFIYSESTWV